MKGAERLMLLRLAAINRQVRGVEERHGQERLVKGKGLKGSERCDCGQ